MRSVNAAPSVKTTAWFDSPSAARNHRKPTAAIRPPIRLSGRRIKAINPLPTKTRPRTTISVARPVGSSSWSLVRTSASDPAAAASASVHAPTRRRVLTSECAACGADPQDARALPVRPSALNDPDQPSYASRQKCGERGAGQLSLRDEAPGAAALDAPRVVLPVAAGRQHDSRPLVHLAQSLRDLESVEVGELNVEQNQVGVQLCDGPNRALPVLRLADHLIPLGLQQRPCAGPEAGMVVDDQNCHAHILAAVLPSRNTASHTLCNP